MSLRAACFRAPCVRFRNVRSRNRKQFVAAKELSTRSPVGYEAERRGPVREAPDGSYSDLGDAVRHGSSFVLSITRRWRKTVDRRWEFGCKLHVWRGMQNFEKAGMKKTSGRRQTAIVCPTSELQKKKVPSDSIPASPTAGMHGIELRS